jgi:hypothetical protein
MSEGTVPQPSSPIAWRITAWLVLAILATAMALLVPRHEAWFDEAQAWLLARDASPWDIIWKYARYEGTPSLWHLLLTIPAKAGAPFITLNYISGALAMCGAALLIFKSPFPRVLRVLLPAGFFFFYQFGLVARNYALMMPLLWIVALLYPGRFTHPWRYVLTLIVLTHVNLHGSLIAGALMTVFVGEAWWGERWSQARLAPLILAFAADTVFIVLQIAPPSDLISPHWYLSGDRARQVFEEMFLGCVMPWPWAAGLVYLVACFFFYQRGVLVSYLFSTGLLLALFIFRFFSPWHQGIVYALLIFHAWLAWRSHLRRRIGSVPERYWPALTTGVLTLTAAVHIWWAVASSWNDWRYAYTGTRAAAQYLHEHGIDRERIHIFKFSNIAILPYLDHNPFANVAPYMPGEFWVWKRAIYDGQSPQGIVQGNPPWILVGAQLKPDQEPKTAPPIPGYTSVAIFPGHMFWKDSFVQTDSYYLYRRAGGQGNQ